MTINEALEAASLQALMQDMAEAKAPVTSGVQRRAAHQTALENFDIDHLLSMQDKMRAAIDQMTANLFAFDSPTTELSDTQLASLMRELLDQKDIKDLIDVRYQMIRTLVFAHITEKLDANGVENPEFAPGEAVVPELGKKFARETSKKISLDEKKLHSLLGEEKWNEVCDITVVPEHVETSLSTEKLLKLINDNPELMEVLRDCILPSKWTARFMVRELRS